MIRCPSGHCFKGPIEFLELRRGGGREQHGQRLRDSARLTRLIQRGKPWPHLFVIRA